MRSIRTRITALTLGAILISIVSFGVIGIYFVIIESNRMSAQTLSLICENRRDTLNEYLTSIEQSVNMISNYAVDSLDSIVLTKGRVLGASGSTTQELPGRSDAQREELDAYFDEHLNFIESAFQSIANHTNGLSSCYYRINPEITSGAKGFFFTRKGVSDFRKIALTDIAAYDPEDIDHVGWYYIPLRQGRPSWIKPYHSAKMDDWVISYAVPIYKAGTFIGVIGMDIQYNTLVTQIRQFSNFKTGYYALADEEGKLYYHPDYEMGTDVLTVLPQLEGITEGLYRDSSSQQMNRYVKDGKKWQMTYTTLVNDMELVAVVEESEINTASHTLTEVFLTAGVLILFAFAAFTTVTLRHVTDPLERLTTAASRLAAGDYDAELESEGNDEVSALTRTFISMRDRLKTQFAELSESKLKLQEALAASEQASLAKTTFLSNMSHEIRTPLNAIIGFTALAEQYIDDRERVLNYILKISTSGKHLQSLINDVLDVSRIESGRLVLRDEVFNFRDFLTQINTIIGGQCANKGQTYVPRIIGAVGCAYSGDEMKLKEVLINILGNAVKYTPNGGTIRFSTEQITSYDELCTLRFIVQDTGIGMSEEFLPKLFDAFSQENDAKVNQFGSTGLGMAITKSIVQLMNGEIQVESKKGVGSTFTITVTLKDAHQGTLTDGAGLPGAADEAAPDRDAAAEQDGDLAGLRVLIVEDIEFNAELLADILDLEDIEHEWAENGQVAVDRFSETPEGYFDAILMDIRMPVMDGLQATRSIRALSRPDAKTVPIIAMSANAFAEDVQQSLQAGMNAHLSKPVDVDRLLETLGKIAAQKA